MKPFTLSSLCRPIIYPVLGFFLGLLWLVSTETGLAASWALLRPFVPGNLSIGRLQGSLWGNIELQDIHYQAPKGSPIKQLRIQQVDCRLSPWALLEHRFRIAHLEILQATVDWAQPGARKGQTPFVLEHAKLSSGLSLSSPTTLNIKLSQFSGHNGSMKFKGQADVSIRNGVPYLGIVQLQYGEQLWRFLPKHARIQAPTTQPVTLAGTLYWQKTRQGPLFQTLMVQTAHPQSNMLKWQLPEFPLRALDFALPENIKWDSNVALSIQYHPPARKKPGYLSGIAVFPSGTILLRDTPYSWIKCPYDQLKLSATVASAHHWSFNLDLKNMKTYLPTQGIAIQEGELQASYVHSPDKPDQFSATGKARLGQGWLFINSKALDTWKLSGESLRLYNTYALTATAAPHLTLQYKAPILYIQGNLAISKANIQLKEQVNQSVLSRDVVFVDSLDAKNKSNTHKDNALIILPDIQLSLKNITLQGYGLEGQLEGDLKIEKRHDGVFTGQGELWINKGNYRLQGKTRNINKGRLYFPSGTLLSDPLLDIRITERNPMQQEGTQEKNFYIQGTLTRPIVQLYNARQKNAQMFSSTNDNPNAQTLLASQSALFLADTAGNNSSLIDRLQSKLHVEDINVESRHTTYNPKTHSDMDTVLTVGSYLTRQVYLQYLKSVLEETSTVKLKYFLGKHWSIGVETGTEGSGSDISFAMDRD